MQSLAVTLPSECSQQYWGTILAMYSLATSLAVAAGAADLHQRRNPRRRSGLRGDHADRLRRELPGARA